jgi:SAM-dependent methyltransferase
MCPRCGSLGRHRVDLLYLTSQIDGLSRPLRLLHIAPEPSLEYSLRRLPNVIYRSADYDSKLAMDRVDIRDMPYGDESFDAIICNHVLQHVDDDAAALHELRRVLRPGGWALLQSAVDLSSEHTVDELSARAEQSGPRGYEEVFMRVYGRDYASRLERAGFTVTVSGFVRDLPPSVCEQLGLDADETIFFCERPKSAVPAPASRA